MKINRRDVLKGALAAGAASAAGIESAQAVEDILRESKPTEAEVERVASKLNEEFKDLPHEEIPEGFTLLPIHKEELIRSAIPSVLNIILARLVSKLERLDKNSEKVIEMDDVSSEFALKWPKKHKRTYVEHQIQGNGSSLHNVGVLHSKEGFLNDENGIYRAIDQADIVLLESGPEYFTEIQRFVESRGKKAEYVDYPIDVTAAVAYFSTFLVAQLALFPHGYKNVSIPNEVLRKLLVVPAYKFSFFALFADVIRLNVKVNKLEVEQLTSFVTDGRTVRMLASALDIAQNPENKGKKIAIITGDTHAQGFEAYLKNQKLFNTKRKIYDVIYAGALFHKKKVS